MASEDLCSRQEWDLEPRDNVIQSSVPTLVLWLLALWVVLLLGTLVWGVGNAETRLRADAQALLEEDGRGLAVDLSGRDASVYGSVESEDQEAEILAAVDAIPGVRGVTSRLQIIAPPEPVLVDPEVSMRLIGDAVSVRGLVPNAEIEGNLIAAAEDQFGVNNIVNALVVSEDVVPQPWLGRIRDVFEHLVHLRSGGFMADESGFVLSGEVISESMKVEIEQEIRLILADTLPLTSNLTIAVLPPPTFFASGSSGSLTLNGALPNQETVDQIADAARRLHPGTTITNGMRIREVAGPAWLESLDGLLDVVTRLDPWTIEVSDDTVTITGLTLDQDLAGAIGLLTEEVVAGQLAVVTDVQVDPAAIAIRLTELLQGSATFEVNSAELSATGTGLLDEAIEILQANPAALLIVEGHTDDAGDAAANLALSQQRAEAVVAYLVAGGIDAERLTAIGYGEERPIADNVTDEGRAQNRRIEFVIQEGDA